MKIFAVSTALAIAFLSVTACQNTTAIDILPSESVITGRPSSQATNSVKNVIVVDDDISPESEIDIATLMKYNWTLVSAVDSSNLYLEPLSDITDQVTLSFGKLKGVDILKYSVGCNKVTGRLVLDANVLTVEENVSTKMYCEELDDAERLLNSAMEGDSQLSLKESVVPILTQIADDNTTLVWQGDMTAKAKYGKGEIIFWAVSHDAEPCPDGTTKECLRIKPITYDKQGVKIAEGEWRLFSGEIEGFNHDERRDQILRLKRYTVAPSDTKGKKNVYILDTVVESLLVKK